MKNTILASIAIATFSFGTQSVMAQNIMPVKPAIMPIDGMIPLHDHHDLKYGQELQDEHAPLARGDEAYIPIGDGTALEVHNLRQDRYMDNTHRGFAELTHPSQPATKVHPNWEPTTEQR